MKEAKIKVLELLQDGKISVEEAAILLDAMATDATTAQAQTNHSDTQKSEAKADDTSVDSDFKSSVEDFVRDTFENVSETLRQGVEYVNQQCEQAKQNKEAHPIDPLKQFEKTLKEVTDRLNKEK